MIFSPLCCLLGRHRRCLASRERERWRGCCPIAPTSSPPVCSVRRRVPAWAEPNFLFRCTPTAKRVGRRITLAWAPHDDLILSVAIALWFAKNVPTFSREEL